MKPGKEHPAWLHRAMGGRCDRPARAEGGRSPKNPGEINDRASEQYLDKVSDTAAKERKSANLSSNLDTAAGIAHQLAGNSGQAAVWHTLAAMNNAKAKKAEKTSKQYGDEASKFEDAQLKDNGDDSFAKGGRLTAKARKHIKPKNFALPGRRYPIEDASHARNALSRVSQNGSSAEKAKVRAAVHRKYPGIGKD